MRAPKNVKGTTLIIAGNARKHVELASMNAERWLAKAIYLSFL
jgi:hypothetical protein